MKTIKALFLLIAMMFSSSSLFAHDFEVDGIYYKITSYTETSVEVTYKGNTVNEYQDEYSGCVSIPRIVKRDGGGMFRVTRIGDYAFLGCEGLTSIEIPNSVTSIGKNAFEDCSGLTSVTIPNSVWWIGESAFFGCSGLTSIDIPNSVTSIGESAFRDCSGLTSVVIGDGVTSIGNEAFFGCSGLTSIVVEDGNSVYDSRNNCNAIIKTSTNELVLGCKTTKIPNSVRSIGYQAFSYCSGLTSVTIPNSVWWIGDYAFWGCEGLTSIEIPNSVRSIGYQAFSYCSGLTSVVIPNSVTSIGYYAFSDCSGLTSVVIPNSVTSIGYCAFSDCSGLTSLTIGSGVKSIDDGAFAGCNNLEKVYAMSSKAVKCSQYIFPTTVYENAALYVPEGSMSSYENTAPWWFFYNISPIPTAIEDVEMDAEDRSASVYNLQGLKMQDAENLPAGIYIKNGKKFMVK